MPNLQTTHVVSKKTQQHNNLLKKTLSLQRHIKLHECAHIHKDGVEQHDKVNCL